MGDKLIVFKDISWKNNWLLSMRQFGNKRTKCCNLKKKGGFARKKNIAFCRNSSGQLYQKDINL